MRGLFSFVGLLIVIAILALVARRQLQGMQPVSEQPGPSSSASAASASFAQQASQVEHQMVDDLGKLMQQRPAQIDGPGEGR